LWNIVRGEFFWVGNRPLNPSDAAKLSNDFERLWLAAPIGVFSQADAAGCGDSLCDETKAHSSYFAVQSNPRLKMQILFRVLPRIFCDGPLPPQPAGSTGAEKERAFSLDPAATS
jgi:lipopolysaccharide/colanic/teichoic acid biosynthesis glycosyltransferase